MLGFSHDARVFVEAGLRFRFWRWGAIVHFKVRRHGLITGAGPALGSLRLRLRITACSASPSGGPRCACRPPSVWPESSAAAVPIARSRAAASTRNASGDMDHACDLRGTTLPQLLLQHTRRALRQSRAPVRTVDLPTRRDLGWTRCEAMWTRIGRPGRTSSRVRRSLGGEGPGAPVRWSSVPHAARGAMGHGAQASETGVTGELHCSAWARTIDRPRFSVARSQSGWEGTEVAALAVRKVQLLRGRYLTWFGPSCTLHPAWAEDAARVQG